MKNERCRDYNHSALRSTSVFRVSYGQRGGGHEVENRLIFLIRLPGVGIIVYYPWLVLTDRPAVSHSRRMFGVLTVERLGVSHHTPGGQQLCVCVLQRSVAAKIK